MNELSSVELQRTTGGIELGMIPQNSPSLAQQLVLEALALRQQQSLLHWLQSAVAD